MKRIDLNVYKNKDGKFYVSDPHMIVFLFDDGQLHFGHGTETWDCFFNTMEQARTAKHNYEVKRG